MQLDARHMPASRACSADVELVSSVHRRTEMPLIGCPPTHPGRRSEPPVETCAQAEYRAPGRASRGAVRHPRVRSCDISEPEIEVALAGFVNYGYCAACRAGTGA
jgi:hypothetical protein